MIGTGWVQHIETYHYCPKCEAEFNAEYEEYEKEQAKKPKQPRPPLEGIEDIGDAPF